MDAIEKPITPEELKEISKLKDLYDEAETVFNKRRSDLLTAINRAVPKNTTLERGAIAKVAAAARWTRGQIDLIRNDKVKM